MTAHRACHARAALMIVAAVLSGCASGGGSIGNTAKPPTNADGPTATVPRNPSDPVVYTLHYQNYTGAEAFIRAAEADVAASLAKVQTSAAPSYGSLRVAFPKPASPIFDISQNPAGGAEAENTYMRFWQLVEDARLKALEKSGLFSSIASETGNIGILDAGSADYALWSDGTLWHLRYRNGNAEDITNSADVVRWLTAVSSFARLAKDTQFNPLSIRLPSDHGKIRFAVLGTDYFSVEPIIPLLDAEFVRQGRMAERMKDRLGGKAKIVVATYQTGLLNMTLADPENTRLAHEANQAFALAATRGKVEALRVSHIFDAITVETADVTDVPLDGYDYVLWEPTANPWTWRYRIAGRSEAYSVVIPKGTQTWNFPDAVRDSIRQTKAAP